MNFLFRRIRSSVLKVTKGGQDPAIYASLSDTQLYFMAPIVERHITDAKANSSQEGQSSTTPTRLC